MAADAAAWALQWPGHRLATCTYRLLPPKVLQIHPDVRRYTGASDLLCQRRYGSLAAARCMCHPTAHGLEKQRSDGTLNTQHCSLPLCLRVTCSLQCRKSSKHTTWSNWLPGGCLCARSCSELATASTMQLLPMLLWGHLLLSVQSDAPVRPCLRIHRMPGAYQINISTTSCPARR